MQTPHITAIKLQDTPIKTLYIEWVEDDTNCNVYLPIAWMLQQFGYEKVTDKQVRGASRSKFFFAAAKKYAHVLIAKAKEDFPGHICRLTCSGSEYPQFIAV